MVKQFHPGDELVPGYKLMELIGRGGFGQVWRASGPGGIEVAMKLIDGLDPKQGDRQLREVRLLKKIRHPNLVPLIAFWLKDEAGNLISEVESVSELRDTMAGSGTGTIRYLPPSQVRPAQLIIAMGLAERNLFERLEECQREGLPGIPVEELLHYLEAAAKAIDVLNTTHRIQHCDIKPQNILILSGEAQVCDFGLAKTVNPTRQASTTAGTMAYGAPEVFHGKGPCAGTDQYSLAISYFELRTGKLPFASEDFSRVLESKRTGTLELSALSSQERKVIAKATALDPTHRFKSCVEFVQMLKRAAEGAPVRLHDPKQGGRILRTTFAALLSAGLIGGGYFAYRHRDELAAMIAPNATTPADREFDRHLQNKDVKGALTVLPLFPAGHRPQAKSELAGAWSNVIKEQLAIGQLTEARDGAKELLQKLPDQPAAREAWRFVLRGMLQAAERSLAENSPAKARADFAEVEAFLTEDHQPDDEPLLKEARLGVLLAQAREPNKLSEIGESLAEYAALQDSLPPVLKANYVLLRALGKPLKDDELLPVLDDVRTLQADVDGAPLDARLDDWGEQKFEQLETDLLERIGRMMETRDIAETADLLASATKIWPSLTGEMKLRRAAKLVKDRKPTEARALLKELRSAVKSEPKLLTQADELEYRLDLDEPQVPFDTLLTRLDPLLKQSDEGVQLLGETLRRAEQESADKKSLVVSRMEAYLAEPPRALTSDQIASLQGHIARIQKGGLAGRIAQSPPDFVGWLKDYEKTGAGGSQDPLLAAMRAEAILETPDIANAEAIVKSSLESARKRVGDPEMQPWATYLDYVDLLAGSKSTSASTRKQAGDAILQLLAVPTTSWRTPHRDRRLAEMLVEAAKRYELPTDDNILRVKTAFPDSEKVAQLVTEARNLLPPNEPPSYDLDRMFVLSRAARDDKASVAEQDFLDEAQSMKRLVDTKEFAERLESDRCVLLVNRLRGLAAIRHYEKKKSTNARDGALTSLARVIRPLFRYASASETTPDKELFDQIVKPAYDFARQFEQELQASPAALKADVAVIAGAYGRIAQREPAVTVPVKDANDAFRFAVALDRRPDYVVGQGRTMREVPGVTGNQIRESLERLFAEENGLSNPGQAHPGLLGLRGEMYLLESRKKNDVPERLALLALARDDFKAAADASPAGERDEFFATYLEGQSAVHLESAFYSGDPDCEQLTDPPTPDTRPWHLRLARETAQQAANVNLRRLPENAFNAWGNSLEDHALYLGQVELYDDAIEQFDSGEREGLLSPGQGASSLFHRGRCRYRYTRAEVDGRPVLTGAAAVQQLKQGRDDLERAIRLFAENKDQRLAEANAWLGYTYSRLSEVQTVAIVPGEEVVTVDQLEAKADEAFARAIAAASQAKSPQWAEFVLRRAEYASQRKTGASPDLRGTLVETLAQPIFDEARNGEADVAKISPSFLQRAAVLKADALAGKFSGLDDKALTARLVSSFDARRELLQSAVALLKGNDDATLEAVLELKLRTAQDTLAAFKDARELFMRQRAASLKTLEDAFTDTKGLKRERIRASFQSRILEQQGLFFECDHRINNKPADLIAASEKYDESLRLAVAALSPLLRTELEKLTARGSKPDEIRAAWSACMTRKIRSHMKETGALRIYAGTTANQLLRDETDPVKKRRYADAMLRAMKPLSRKEFGDNAAAFERVRKLVEQVEKQ